MANHMVGGDTGAFGVTSAERAVAGSVSTPGDIYTTPGSYTSITDLRTRLAAIDGTLYTSAKLDKMTVNDMIYAIRVNDDPDTIRE